MTGRSVHLKLEFQLTIEKNYKVFQELNISNVSNFLIDYQSNTLFLMNIIIPDISKLALKTPEQSCFC